MERYYTHTHTLTEAIVPIMCQAEAIVACAPVISRDVDALVDAAAVVLGGTLVNIWKKKKKQDTGWSESSNFQ